MSEFSTQQAAIKSIVESVAAVGRVHDRPRYGDAYDMWVVGPDDGFDHPQIRAWEIALEDTIRTARVSNGFRHRYRPWSITGYLGLVDADHPDGTPQSPTFGVISSLAEAIADAIDADPTLGGTCLHLHADGDGSNAVAVGRPVPIFIGGDVLCWAVVLTFTAYTVIV